MRPIIKWPGGKYSEFKHFKDLIPKNYDRYIEPFFGSGGVYFNLEPKVKSYINDKSVELISFYKLLNDENFRKELYLYATNWKSIKEFSDNSLQKLIPLYEQYKKDE